MPWFSPDTPQPAGAPNMSLDFEDLLRQALGIAQQEYDANAPLRERARSFLSGPVPQARDLSSLFADPNNPYARSVPRPPVMPLPPGGQKEQAPPIVGGPKPVDPVTAGGPIGAATGGMVGGAKPPLPGGLKIRRP